MVFYEHDEFVFFVAVADNNNGVVYIRLGGGVAHRMVQIRTSLLRVFVTMSGQ